MRDLIGSVIVTFRDATMITIITGIPGTGKTTYAVWLTYNYYKRDDVHIISNIDSFAADEQIDDNNFSSFILGRDWESYSQTVGKKLIFIIDEAQRFYGNAGMDRLNQNKLFFFLEYHRHYGADVYLITQSHYNLHKRVVVLASQLAQISKIKNLKGEIRVKNLDPVVWEKISVIKFKPDQELYSKFKTANSDYGKQKPLSPMLRIFKALGLYVIVLIFALTILIYMVASKLGFFDDELTDKKKVIRCLLLSLIINLLINYLLMYLALSQTLIK